jgi:hypothetical protein
LREQGRKRCRISVLKTSPMALRFNHKFYGSGEGTKQPWFSSETRWLKEIYNKNTCCVVHTSSEQAPRQMLSACIKGAIGCGVAGHMAGHGAVGATARCVIGHHRTRLRIARPLRLAVFVTEIRGHSQSVLNIIVALRPRSRWAEEPVLPS